MSVEARARAWRTQRRRVILAEGGAVVAASSVAWFGVLALLDRWSALPRGARLGAFAGWIVAESWVAVRKGWEPWRAAGWESVFADAAARWPRTRPLFSSAWALRDGPAATGTSEELRVEHLARADRLAATLPADPLYAPSLSRSARAWSAAALTALALNAFLGDPASWRRVAAPWDDAGLERWVEVTPGDARVDWGAALEIRAVPRPGAAAAGVEPGALSLETRGADGVWRGLPWRRVDADAAGWRAESLTAPLEYRVRWRDAVGRAWRLEPVPPPRWTRAVAVVKDSRGEKRFVLGEDAAVRARRGDWIQLEAESDAALASAAIRVADAPGETAMRPDGKAWRGGFPAQADGSFSFDLVAADGRRDPSPPSYALVVAADAPPVAELLSPQVPMIASPEDAVTVTYAARDDSGLTRAALVVSVAGRPDRVLALPVPAGAPAEILGDYSWSLAGLVPGSRASFRIEAWDDAVPPQRGVSESGTVEIVDAAADHAAALAARDAAQTAVERAASRAESARDAAARGELAASASETGALRKEWAEARKALDEWTKRAQSDPRGDPGLAAEAARSAEEFARAGDDGLPAAEKALARGDGPAAAREQGALAAQARGVGRAMREGADAQSVQDFAREMGDAQKSSERMAAAAAELAARGKDGTVSAAELEKLENALAEVEKQLEALRQAVKAMPEVSPEQATGKSEDLPLDEARGAAGDLRRALQSGDVAGAASAARRLAEKLKRLSETLDSAGRRAADARGRRSSEAADRVRRSWREAVEAQTRAVEAARKVENARLDGLVERQRASLRDSTARFDRAASSWTAAGAARLAPGSVDEAGRRLKSGDGASAVKALRAAAERLRAAAGPDAAGDGPRAFAAELESIAGALEKGPAAPPADPARARAAADEQAAARERTRALRGEVKDAAEKLGYLSGRVERRVDDALGEQALGEGALRAGDSGEGLKRAEAALGLLEEGGKDADDAAGSAGSASALMGGSSGGSQGGMKVIRSAGPGSTGSRIERVRLPTADEYRPPKELREELQRSLREPRPASQDAVIKEYFKRLTR